MLCHDPHIKDTESSQQCCLHSSGQDKWVLHGGLVDRTKEVASRLVLESTHSSALVDKQVDPVWVHSEEGQPCIQILGGLLT